jgi:hypothetical protein
MGGEMLMTPARKDLLAALCQIQNHPAFTHQDILTITGCGMTDFEVRAHIDACMTSVANFNFDKAHEGPRRNRKAA